ncbi:MAG: permease [Chloroflexi bacterium]|nr:permease [Chloroflexota bacterium]
MQATTSLDVKRYGARLVWTLLGLAFTGLVFAAALGTGQDAVTILSIFSTRFLGIFIEAAPFLLLGTLASGVIEAFVTQADVVRWLPRNPVLATLGGTFMGFAFPVCECGVVPVARRLFTKGLPMSVGVAFLMAAPVMNPVVLVSTYIAFGTISPAIFVGRFVLTALIATAIGLVFALAARPQDVLRPQNFAPVMGGSAEAASTPAPRRALLPGLIFALKTAGDEFFEMGRYLIIGSLLAAAMQTLVSQEVLLALGRGPVVSVLVMQMLAFLLSVCSTVDAFLALAFVGTFTTGSLISFLTFGPMVDIKSTLMFAGVFNRRTVAYLVVLPFLMALFAGIWMNLNLSF